MISWNLCFQENYWLCFQESYFFKRATDYVFKKATFSRKLWFQKRYWLEKLLQISSCSHSFKWFEINDVVSSKLMSKKDVGIFQVVFTALIDSRNVLCFLSRTRTNWCCIYRLSCFAIVCYSIQAIEQNKKKW